MGPTIVIGFQYLMRFAAIRCTAHLQERRGTLQTFTFFNERLVTLEKANLRR